VTFIKCKFLVTATLRAARQQATRRSPDATDRPGAARVPRHQSQAAPLRLGNAPHTAPRQAFSERY